MPPWWPLCQGKFQFHPILVTDVCGFADVLIRFWGQRSTVTVTASNDPKTLWTPYLTNQWREFCSILVTDVRGFIDVLISFWGQRSKVKVTAGGDTSHKPIKAIYPILVTDVLGFAVLISFWGQKVKVTAGNDLKTGWIYNIFVNIWANFTKI